MHTVKKQQLLMEPLSNNALKLARALYHTYKKDEDLYIKASLKVICSIFKIDTSSHSIKFLVDIFEELNEPIMVQNFKFYTKKYDRKFLTFCKYKITSESVEVMLNEEFLYAEKEYMLDNFLSN